MCINVDQKNIHFFGDDKRKYYCSIDEYLFISGTEKYYKIASTTRYIMIFYDPKMEKFGLPKADGMSWQSADEAHNYLKTEIQQIRKDRTDFLEHFHSRLSSDGFTMPEMVTILEEFGKIKGYAPSLKEIQEFKGKYER